MTLNIERDIDGDSQQDSFQNATLQTGPPGYEFSIAVHVDVPMIGVYDQETLAQFLERTFAPVAGDPRVSIEIQMGREGAGDVYWISDMEACAPEALSLNNGVEVRLQEDGGHCPYVTLIAESSERLMQYIRHHWGDSDEEWLQQVEEDIQYGDLSQTASLAVPLTEPDEESSEEASIRRKEEDKMVTVKRSALSELANDVAQAIENHIGLGEALLDKGDLEEGLEEYLDGYGVLWDYEELQAVEDPQLEAIVAISKAIGVITPIAQSMKQFGHTQADEVAGALSDLELARHLLRGEEVPA